MVEIHNLLHTQPTASDDGLSGSGFLVMMLHLLCLLSLFTAEIDSPAQDVSVELGLRTILKIFVQLCL